jgi:multiple sugar transport system substrate-binding protein
MITLQPMSRRRFLKETVVASSLLVTGGGLLSSCGGSPSSSTKPTSLNMLYATVEADSDAIKAVLPSFKSEVGITLNVDTIPYDALQQKVFAELASSSPHYDIMIVDTPWMPALTGKIEPLISYINNPKLNDVAKPDLQDFIAKVFYDTAVYNPSKPYLHYPDPTQPIDTSAIAHQGFEIFGFPIQANVLTMSYRKDLFEDAHEQAAFQQQYKKPLQVPATWDDFVTVAQFFTRPAQHLYGTTLMAGDGDWATDDFKTLLACWGGDGHLVSDKFQLEFDTPTGVAALTFYTNLINQYKVTPPGVTEFSWDTAASTFGSGLTAMSMNYHNVSLNSGVKGTVAYAMVPKQVTYGPHFGTWMLSVNSFSQNKEWAYRTITWLTSSATQIEMLKQQLHPSRISVYQKAVADTSLTQQFGNFYDILGKSLAVGVGRPRLTDYSDVDQAIWVAVNNAATRSQTPQAALSQAATRVKTALQQAGYPVS